MPTLGFPTGRDILGVAGARGDCAITGPILHYPEMDSANQTSLPGHTIVAACWGARLPGSIGSDKGSIWSGLRAEQTSPLAAARLACPPYARNDGDGSYRL